jgi:hypothetical protein
VSEPSSNERRATKPTNVTSSPRSSNRFTSTAVRNSVVLNALSSHAVVSYVVDIFVRLFGVGTCVVLHLFPSHRSLRQ